MNAAEDKDSLLRENQEIDFGGDDDLLLDELDLPDDGSFVLDEPADNAATEKEQAMAGIPEPPSLDDLDLDVARGSAIRNEDTSDEEQLSTKAKGSEKPPWEDEILFSEELPAEEPEIDEIDSMLGAADVDLDEPESAQQQQAGHATVEARDNVSDEISNGDLVTELSEDDFASDLDITEPDLDLSPADDDSGTDDHPTMTQEIPPATDNTAELPDISEDEDALDLDEGEFDLLAPEEVQQTTQQEVTASPAEISFEREMAGAPSSKDFFAEPDEEEDDEILLSDEELEGITSESSKDSDDFFSDSDYDEEITLSEEELGGIMEDAVPEAPATTAAEETSAAPPEGFFTDDEDEEISLSSDELDGIMADAVPEEVTAEQEGETEAALAATEKVADFFSDSDEEEPITLSPDELDGILEDVTEEPAGNDATEMLLEEAEHTPPVEIMDEPVVTSEANEIPLADLQDEDEGDITLSADELEGILEDADIPEENEDSLPLQETELAADTSLHPAEAESTPGTMSHGSDFFNEEEEGPITLSDEELDGILADADSTIEESAGTEPPADMGVLTESEPTNLQPESTVQPILKDDSEAVVLTENLDKAALEGAEARAAAIEQKSEGPMPPREELRKMIAYLDNLLGELPDETIAKFAQSEYFKLYQKVMEQLDL